MFAFTFFHHACLSQSTPTARGSSCVFTRLQSGAPEALGQNLLLRSSCHPPAYPEHLPIFTSTIKSKDPISHTVYKKPTNKQKKTIMRIHNKTKFTSQQSKFMFIRLQETAYNYLFSKQCCCCFFFKQISMLFVLCLIFRNFMFMAVY